MSEIASLQRTFDTLSTTFLDFLKYAPVEVVRMLMKYQAEAVLGMERKEITAFFSDIGLYI